MLKTKKQQPHQLLLETHSKWSLHYLTGHNLNWYARIIARPLVYLASLNIALHIVSEIPTLGIEFNNVFVPIVFMVEIITFGWIGWLLAHRASAKTMPFSMKLMSFAITGGLLGIILGIILGLFRVFWYRAPWTFFNIITEPVIRGIEGFIISGIIGLITLFIILIRNRQNNLA